MERPDVTMLGARAIDSLGRIVIHTEAREALHLTETDYLDMYLDKSTGEIILRKHMSSCMSCGQFDNLVAVLNKPNLYMCKTCLKKMTLCVTTSLEAATE